MKQMPMSIHLMQMNGTNTHFGHFKQKMQIWGIFGYVEQIYDGKA